VPGSAAHITEVEIRAALGHIEPATLAWAAGPSLLLSFYSDPAFPLESLRRLADEAPAETADALLMLLEQRGISVSGGFAAGGLVGGGGGMSFVGGAGMGRSGLPQINLHSGNLPLIIQAVMQIADHTTEPQRALA